MDLINLLKQLRKKVIDVTCEVLTLAENEITKIGVNEDGGLSVFYKVSVGIVGIREEREFNIDACDLHLSQDVLFIKYANRVKYARKYKQ